MTKETVKTTLAKNKKADIPTKSGKDYSYQYIDIAQIHEYLEENNMSYYQYIDRINDDDYIMTVPIINGEEKAPRRGSRVVQATLQGNNNPAQEQGSALTYARRYSLLMAFGLATEDDDAVSLSNKKEVKEPTIDDAKEYIITFGKKHKDKKLVDVIEEDVSYINYLVNNTNNEYLLKCIELLTGVVKPTEEEQDERLVLTEKLQRLIVDKGIDLEAMLDYYKVANTNMLNNEQLKELIERFEKRADK